MDTKRITTAWLLSLVVLTISTFGQSGIYVEFWNGSAWVRAGDHPDRNADPPEPGYPSGSDIDIENANNVTYRVFAVTPSSTDIGRITINAPNQSVQPRLLVGRFNALTEPTASQRLDAAGARDVESIFSGTGKVRMQVWVKRDILSGGVDTHEVVRIDVDRDILGPISHRPVLSGTPTLGRIEVVGNIDPVSGGIVAFGGNIGTIKTVFGSLLGGVIAVNGDIELIEIGGDIGAPGNPVAIEAGGIIKYINVPNGNLHADISATKLERSYGEPHEPCLEVGGNVSDTTITLTDSLRDHFTITGGDFALSSETHMIHLADAAEFKIEKDGNGIGGSMLGDMYFTGVLGDQSLIEIDRSLAGNMVFNGNGTSSLNDDIFILGDLGAGEGLTGQIILNADATPGEAWGNGELKFGPDGDPNQFKLEPKPYYNNKSVDFGGGAVGRVPYYLHYADSQPTGTKVNEGPDGHENGLSECEEGYHALKKVHPSWSLPKVTLQHYGPILQEGTGKPFTVKRKTIYTLACDAGGNPNWADVTANFTHSFPAGDDRAIEINGSFEPGYDYLIEPKVDENGTDYLYCGGLDASVGMVPIKDYDYRLRVIVAPDITGNGLLEADDITAWILDPQDANLDGTTDDADLVEVINAVAEYGE